MKIKITFLFGLLLFSTQITLGKDPVWLEKMRSITLLESTRGDVIKLFGQPKKSNINYIEYFFVRDGRFSVTYSRGKCITQMVNGKEIILDWEVPEGTVISIGFSPNKAFKPEKLKINFSGFQKYSPLEDSSRVSHYENSDLGINYTLHKGKIELIRFTPPRRGRNLRCKQ